MIATTFPNVPDGGGGGGGALGFELEPPCGPSEAIVTPGTPNVSNAIKQRLNTYIFSFFMLILRFYRHDKP